MTLSEERPHQSNQFTSCESSIKCKEAERKEIEKLTKEWLKKKKLKSVPFDPIVRHAVGAPENALGIDLGAHRRKLGLNTNKDGSKALPMHMDLEGDF